MKIRIPVYDKEVLISDFAAYNFFLWLNLLVFFDRGIIPGSTTHFNEFIVQSTGSTRPDVLLGALQSCFSLGLVLGSLALSYLVVRHDRFVLASVALFIWIFAVILSGISYYANSFVLLLLARTLAGFGEASILFDIPSWIQSVAPQSHRGTWLGIFYTAIPLGTALGYGYAAAIADSSLSWSFTFFFEGFLALPLLFFLGNITDDSPESDNSGHGGNHGRSSPDVEEDKETESPDHLRADEYVTLADSGHKSILQKKDVSPTKSSPKKASKPVGGETVTRRRRNSALQIVLTRVSLYDGIVKAVQSPVFLSVALASAAQAATMTAWSTFGSPILMNLGYYEEEIAASTAFGLLMGIAALIGTPLGGYILDFLDPGGYSEKDMKKHVFVYYIRQPFLHTTDNQALDDSDGEEGGIDGGNNQHHRHTKNHTMLSFFTQSSSSKSANSIADDKKYHLYILIQRACAVLYWLSLLTFVSFVVCVFVTQKFLFLFIISMGFIFCYATSAAVVISQTFELKHAYHAIASEIGLLVVHLLGDVPAPLISGALKAHYTAEVCAVSPVDDVCRNGSGELRWMIFYIGLCTFASVFFSAIAWWQCSNLCYQNILAIKRKRDSAKRSSRNRKQKKSNKPPDTQRLLDNPM